MDANGLEGVVVAETALSDVDGERGRLVIRGHDVEQLALRHDFESVCALLWDGALPDARAHAALRQGLGRARVRAFARLGALGDALAADDAMDALRAALGHLRADEIAPAALKLEITAAVAVFAAAWSRLRDGAAPLPPDPALGHAADFLRMAGVPGADAARARALDAYLVTASDHGMNASTFTARVVASTHSDAVSAVVAAIGALKGPLHGGAPGPVLAMLDAIGTPEQAPHWIACELAAGHRIMGMGHRVYRVRDPRAAVLEHAIERLHAAGVRSNRLALARAVEAVAVASLGERRPERRLAANVEFYTAVILDAVGLPQALFSPTFAVARVAGWLAHVDEQRAHGRLIRPASRYVGPMPELVAVA
ncbi:MAG TPA: citrate synthase [Burkholderiaceae bacterium]|nr:citrate synthase [Burkholderiaceae bacterium]